MDCTRRAGLFLLLTLPLTVNGQEKSQPPFIHIPAPLYPGEDPSRPNGKSKEEIAEQNREEALKDLQDLVSAAQQLQAELKKAGSYVIPADSSKKTKEIEKLARRIRGLLKG